jgi:hypothetical protein
MPIMERQKKEGINNRPQHFFAGTGARGSLNELQGLRILF